MWYNTAIIKFIFSTLNTLTSYTVTYDTKGVDEILRYDTLIDEGPRAVIEVAIEQTDPLLSCSYGGKLGVGVVFERRKRIRCSHFSLVSWGQRSAMSIG